jgi:methylated-DNA-protein-cysteine methyltransferase related protein
LTGEQETSFQGILLSDGEKRSDCIGYRTIVYKKPKNVKRESAGQAPDGEVGGAAIPGYTPFMPTESTMMIVELLRSIPSGKVVSYGGIAEMAGLPGGAGAARQVVRILSSMSRKYDLPWWRVVKKDGRIALGEGEGRELQRSLLEAEGIEFEEPARVDMRRFGIR